MPSLDSLNTLKTLKVADQTYHYYSLTEAARQLGALQRLPMSLKVLLENLLRWEDGKTASISVRRPGTAGVAPEKSSSTPERKVTTARTCGVS
jgi:aconitase A